MSGVKEHCGYWSSEGRSGSSGQRAAGRPHEQEASQGSGGHSAVCWVRVAWLCVVNGRTIRLERGLFHAPLWSLDFIL